MFELAPARSYSQTRPAKGWPKLGKTHLWLAMGMVMTMGLAMAMAIATAVATTMDQTWKNPKNKVFSREG